MNTEGGVSTPVGQYKEMKCRCELHGRTSEHTKLKKPVKNDRMLNSPIYGKRPEREI